MRNSLLPTIFGLMCFMGALAQQTPNMSLNDTVKQGQESNYRHNPWQQSSGEFLLSPYISHYRANSYRNSSGEKQDFSNDGEFYNYNPRLYFSVPLNSDKLNIYGSIPFFTNVYKDNLNKNSNSDLGDIELGLRFNLARFSDNYLMGAVSGYIPAYSNTQDPVAGFALFALEPKIILGGTFNYFGGYRDFHKLEVSVRYFLPDDPLQFRFLLSQGYHIGNNFIALAELEGMFSSSKNQEFFEENLRLVAEYRLIKASFNLGYRFTDGFELYGGVFHDVFNRNSAIGRGVQFFAVIKTD